MSTKVEFELNAKDSNSLSAWQRQERAVNSIIERLGKLDDASKKAEKSQTGWLEAGIGQFAAMATGAGVFATVLNQIGREYDNMLSRQSKALNVQVNLAAAQRQAVMNLGTDPNWNAEKLTNSLREMSQRIGVDEATLTTTASDALSARGDLSVDDTLKAVEAAARLMPDAPSSLPTLSAAAMDLSKVSGSTAEQSLGFLQSVGSAARVTDLKSLAENIGPGISAIGKFGATEREAGALLAALSGAMVDPTGAQTKTSGIALAKQLEAFLPKEEGTIARIEKLQNDPKLAKRFMKTASFEAAAMPVIRGLLMGDKDSAERRGLDSALKSIVDIKAGDALYNSSVESIDSLPAVKAARAKQATEAATTMVSAEDSSGSRAAIFRDALVDALKASKVSDMAQRVSSNEYEARVLAGENPAEVAAKILRNQAAGFANPMMAPMGPGGMPTARPATAEEKATADNLAKTAEAMERAAKALENAAKKPVEVKVKPGPDVPRVPASARAGRGR